MLQLIKIHIKVTLRLVNHDLLHQLPKPTLRFRSAAALVLQDRPELLEADCTCNNVRQGNSNMNKHPVLFQECKNDEHKVFRNRLLYHLAEGERCELSLLSLCLVRVGCTHSLIQFESCPCDIQDKHNDHHGQKKSRLELSYHPSHQPTANHCGNLPNLKYHFVYISIIINLTATKLIFSGK